jgi:excisionase family DNA binding protein
MDEPSLLLDRGPAAHQLSISVRKLDLMIASGEIPVIRVGRRVLVSRAALEDFVLKASPVSQGKVVSA